MATQPTQPTQPTNIINIMNPYQISQILHEAHSVASYLQTDEAPEKLAQGGNNFSSSTDYHRNRLKEKAAELQQIIRDLGMYH